MAPVMGRDRQPASRISQEEQLTGEKTCYREDSIQDPVCSVCELYILRTTADGVSSVVGPQLAHEVTHPAPRPDIAENIPTWQGSVN